MEVVDMASSGYLERSLSFFELWLELAALLLSGPVARLRLSSIVAADALTVTVLARCDRRMRIGCGSCVISARLVTPSFS